MSTEEQFIPDPTPASYARAEAPAYLSHSVMDGIAGAVRGFHFPNSLRTQPSLFLTGYPSFRLSRWRLLPSALLPFPCEQWDIQGAALFALAGLS